MSLVLVFDKALERYYFDIHDNFLQLYAHEIKHDWL